MGEERRVVMGQMTPRVRKEWKGSTVKKQRTKRRLLRNASACAAVALCLGAIGGLVAGENPLIARVMSHVTAEFEYDDSLGRLQFVSNVLPESAMVFLNSTESETLPVSAPVQASESHAWTQEEPWMEYMCMGVVTACSDGEVMTIVQNREGEYTVRLRHENGYESIYSGLSEVNLQEGGSVLRGEQVGWTDGFAAFELRQDGLSIQPVFSVLE